MSLTWVGGKSAADLAKHFDEETMKLGYRLANDGLDKLSGNIEMNTPVATSHLRNSYKSSDVKYVQTEHQGMLVWCWTGKVYTQVEYAPYVEYGTGLWGPDHAKYKIEPKKPGGVLRFTPYAHGPSGDVILDVSGGVTKQGTAVYARFVMHPGSPGQSMFRIGAIMTEHQINEWTRNALEEWRAKVMTL